MLLSNDIHAHLYIFRLILQLTFNNSNYKVKTPIAYLLVIIFENLHILYEKYVYIL